jgi:site-specific DNA-cytosine methylase
MENVEDALRMAPNWPYTTLRDFDCGGLTFRTRSFWFYGIAPVVEPHKRQGKPVYSVLASSWMTRNTAEEFEGGMHVHSNLPAEEAARLQGFPGLHKQIMDAQPSSGSTKPYTIGLSKRSREILAIHMLGNGIPRAMGEYIAKHVKRQVLRRDDWDRVDMPPYPLFMQAGK